MISIIGIGRGASKIAKKFDNIPQYDVYTLNSAVEKNTENEFKLDVFEDIEEYEHNIPDLKKFFKGRIQ